MVSNGGWERGEGSTHSCGAAGGWGCAHLGDVWMTQGALGAVAGSTGDRTLNRYTSRSWPLGQKKDCTLS